MISSALVFCGKVIPSCVYIFVYYLEVTINVLHTLKRKNMKHIHVSLNLQTNKKIYIGHVHRTAERKACLLSWRGTRTKQHRQHLDRPSEGACNHRNRRDK